MGRLITHTFPPTVSPEGKPFTFGRLVETVKDVFVIEIQGFFKSRARLAEIPNIEKFHFDDPMNAEAENDRLLTWTHIILQYPDINQRLPLIAVTTAGGTQKKMSIGNNFVGVYWKIPEIRTSVHEPFALEDGQVLNYSTIAGASSLTFSDTGFVDIHQVSAYDLAYYINIWAPDLQALMYDDVEVGGVMRRGVAIRPLKAPASPDNLTVLASGGLNEALGIPPGTTDSSTDDPPYKRYSYAMSMNIGLDVGATTENTRKELVDLLINFLQFYVAERDSTFFGEANALDANGDVVQQPFQIILSGEQSKTGEAEIPRPEGDQTQKIYVDRLNIPITAIEYLDRPVTGFDQGVIGYVSSFV